MKLSVRSFALACGLILGASMLFLGLAHWLWTGYVAPLLEDFASVYPGYAADGGLGNILLGTTYGFLDGAIAGSLLAFLYNTLASAPRRK